MDGMECDWEESRRRYALERGMEEFLACAGPRAAQLLESMYLEPGNMELRKEWEKSAELAGRLEEAALSGDEGACARLLLAGADPDGPDALLEDCAGMDCGASGKICPMLIAAGASISGPQGRSVAAAAAASGNFVALEALLSAAPLQARADLADMALGCAAQAGSADCLRLALEHGADPDGDMGWALFSAVESKQPAMALALAGLCASQESLGRALHLAAAMGDGESAAGLLEAGADPSYGGWAGLREACERGRRGMVMMLAPLGGSAELGQLPLAEAALDFDEELCRFLLPYGQAGLAASKLRSEGADGHADFLMGIWSAWEAGGIGLAAPAGRGMGVRGSI